jgi:hypothetical protein
MRARKYEKYILERSNKPSTLKRRGGRVTMDMLYENMGHQEQLIPIAVIV